MIKDLVDIVGPDHVLTLDADREPFETDWTGRFRGHAAAVVRPRNVDEVIAVGDLCRAQGIALVPQGGNTGLVGGTVPSDGAVILNLRRLDRVEPVDVAARQVTAQAGATVAALQRAAYDAGLAYAVDLAARDSATVGGTVATNAGGLNLMRYGGTREQLIGVDAVLGTGDRVTHLGGLVKDNTGYHLPSLLCGSEGTLGIVLAARLHLVSRYEHRVSALIGFDATERAVEAVGAWKTELDDLEAAEFFLDDGLTLVCEAFGLRPPLAERAPIYVLVEAAAHDDPTARLAAAVEHTDGVRAVAVDSRTRALWRYREDHTLAINTLGPPHKLDVTLPMSALAAFIDEAGSIVQPPARTWLFGHLGDGNVHVNITGLAADDDRADELVLRKVASLGGSISAEHGIGTVKRRWLSLSRSPAEIRAMSAIKTALDPVGFLNPGVMWPAGTPTP